MRNSYHPSVKKRNLPKTYSQMPSTKPKKLRKLIDIPLETLAKLKVKAAESKRELKPFIEYLLDEHVK